jgi:cyclophilin family peptidyl-prolyl cis-trans isomerase
MSTKGNAFFSAAVLARRGLSSAKLVTCDWHMPRAYRLFTGAGLDIERVAVPSGRAPWPRRLWLIGREGALSFLLVACLLLPVAWSLLLVACSRTGPPLSAGPDAGFDSGPPTSETLAAIARAEDLRRAQDIPADALRSRDPVVRRRSARARARILDDDGAPLLRALNDEDDEVVAWSAFGLGESCKGREDRVSALAARLASLGDDPSLTSRLVLLRALGRCATELAEVALRPWVRGEPRAAEAAAFALGEVAARRGELSTETSAALLDAATAMPPLDAALYPFSRVDLGLPPPAAGKLKVAARALLARPGSLRILGVRALARLADAGSVGEVARLLESRDALCPERVEAVHALARMKEAGQVALAEVVLLLARAPDALRRGGGSLNVLLSAVQGLAGGALADARESLWALARLEPPPAAPPGALRRVSMLRCAAAGKLARGALDSDVLQRCDLTGGEVGQRARLDALALETSPFPQSRRAALSDLARSSSARIRQAALDLAVRRPEMGEAARELLARALSANEPGTVATAAALVKSHPERVFVLAASERRAALDPRAPAPRGPPARELDASIAAALRGALARPWSPDLVETRAALLEAACAAGLPEGRAVAEAACKDENATMRLSAARALSAAGVAGARCPSPDVPGRAASELGHEVSGVIRIALATDAGQLSLVLDPVGAPVAVTRLLALARAGFYTGTSFHRVVPGYLAQFGDPSGDGYGGSGQLLRCETSPAPFGRGDVGVALAGRDTGSSQLFVMLARHPQLDGEYTWVGHAEGDWDDVVEGDVIREVRVEPP